MNGVKPIKNIRKYLETIKTSSWLLFVFLMIALFFIPSIFKMIYPYIPNQKIGTKSDWIGFSGSYIAVVLTILGINYQNRIEEKRKEKKELEEQEMLTQKYFYIVIEELKKIKIFLDTVKEAIENEEKENLQGSKNIKYRFSKSNYFEVDRTLVNEVFLKTSTSEFGNVLKAKAILFHSENLILRAIKDEIIVFSKEEYLQIKLLFEKNQKEVQQMLNDYIMKD